MADSSRSSRINHDDPLLPDSAIVDASTDARLRRALHDVQLPGDLGRPHQMFAEGRALEPRTSLEGIQRGFNSGSLG